MRMRVTIEDVDEPMHRRQRRYVECAVSDYEMANLGTVPGAVDYKLEAIVRAVAAEIARVFEGALYPEQRDKQDEKVANGE